MKRHALVVVIGFLLLVGLASALYFRDDIRDLRLGKILIILNEKGCLDMAWAPCATIHFPLIHYLTAESMMRKV